MARIQAMLDAHPRSHTGDSDALARTIEALVECANTCTQCADACLGERDAAQLATCIRLNLDCADICGAAARVLSRQTARDALVTRSLLEACATACSACGDECAAHAAHMKHCEMCAEACRRCEDACRELAAALV